MKKIAILLAMLFLAQMVMAAEFTGSYAGVKAQADSLNKPILLEFFADW